MLLRGLNTLGQQMPETVVVGDNGEMLTEEIMAKFFDSFHDCNLFLNIC